jgi:hypothetical protein
MIHVKVHLPSSKIIYESYKDRNLTIGDLLEDIENKTNLQNEPFSIVYDTNVFHWYDRSKLYEVFTSKEPIILTIIKSKAMPTQFYTFNNLINYINNLNSTKYEHLNKLVLTYIKYENHYDPYEGTYANEAYTDENIKLKITNIHFIVSYINEFFNESEKLPYHICTNILNNECIIDSIKINGYMLRFASERLQNDKNIVKIAVTNFGGALKFASKNLQDDEDIVLAAVKHCGEALDYASIRLQNDIKIVTTAVQRDGEALRYASKNLQNNKELVMIAMQTCDWIINTCSEELQNDEEIKKLINN